MRKFHKSPIIRTLTQISVELPACIILKADKTSAFVELSNIKNTFLECNFGSYLQYGLFSFLSKMVTLKKIHQTEMKLTENHLTDFYKLQIEGIMTLRISLDSYLKTNKIYFSF